MIKNVIFDFGAILLPIDMGRTWKAFEALGAKPELSEQDDIFHPYERGEITTDEFIQRLQPHFFRNIFPGDVKAAWNRMLDPMDDEIITFLKKIKKQHNIFLLSNTNELHVQHIRQVAGPFLFKRFMEQFEEVYFSHEVGMRKPDKGIFEKVLKDHDLNPEETFFVDDGKKHTLSAAELGIHTWHFKPEEDDIFDLPEKLRKID